ncbi:MAG: hypothetical protein PHN19_03140 [Patescibacteria group bacterium]|nr:hypothetical protein [Patescibacteria group bacterium]
MLKKVAIGLTTLILFTPLTFIDAKLLYPKNLIYKGAFKIQGEEETSPYTYSYGGQALAFYPQGDPSGTDSYSGSLYTTSHDQFQYISEITIPKPVISKNLDNLNSAETLQGFTDIKDNLFGELELPTVGLTYLARQKNQTSGKIYYTWGQHMQEGQRNPAYGFFNLNLSNPKTKGPWKMAKQDNYVTTRYLFNIPKSWAKKYVNNKRLVTGRYRDGGQGAQGPSLFAYSLNQPLKSGSSIKNTPLLQYQSYYEDPNANNALNNYKHSDNWSGGAWLTTKNKSAVIFVGIKGIGKTWYGYYDGTIWPDNPPFPEVGPGERGWWSEHFEAQILFYKQKDLAKVTEKKIEPYQPQPYATKKIEKRMFFTPTTEFRRLGGIAYDRKHNRLYITEFRGNQDNQTPIFHVYKIK